jgi:hypothetical protein
LNNGFSLSLTNCLFLLMAFLLKLTLGMQSTTADQSSNEFPSKEKTLSPETVPQALDQWGVSVFLPTCTMSRKPNRSFISSEDHLHCRQFVFVPRERTIQPPSLTIGRLASSNAVRPRSRRVDSAANITNVSPVWQRYMMDKKTPPCQ